MKVRLNLATHPFGRNRLFWLLCGASFVAAAAVAVMLTVYYVQNREVSPERAQLELNLRSQLSELTAEEAQLKQELEEPGNETVLARSAFLNELLYRKGISWTRTFADIEEILPPRVRMMHVRPAVTADNNIFLEMHVGAETPKDFIEFLKVLESSEWFGSPDVRGSSPPTDNNPLFQYRLTVSYVQQL